ncbi:hypothetical protein JTE90_023880 [Oedothorax gibbosus]|uniref:Uncharacterized protein n=1 Tax=Oedothorax gibbosus TaxID=931172 RepID=A0AAV6UMB8_9ARAC|nr:hypothetical protein JTE90_023880 [Oedothorax gibbosus]
MASIGRWLYRLFDDEEIEEEIGYPEELNPFADDEENEQEKDYPEELNPFANEEDDEHDPGIVNQSSLELYHGINSPAINGSSSTVHLANEEKTEDMKDESGQQEVEYPESLNPFSSEDDEHEYPEELNPFAHEEDDEAAIEDGENEQYGDSYLDELNPFADNEEDAADTVKGIQCSPEFAPQLAPPASNGSSSTVHLANEEKTEDMKDESGQQEVEYPESLNPFSSEDDEHEYPEELNPFAHEEDDEAAIEDGENEQYAPPASNGSSSTVALPIDEKAKDGKNEREQQEHEYPDSLNPFANEDDENEYPEELNPFAEEDEDAADTAIVNQCSPEFAPELTPPAISGSSSTVPLANEEKAEDRKDESEQQEDEYPDILNPFGNEDDENDYPDELNPFAADDVDAADTAKVNQSSLELAPEQTPPAINGSSSTLPLANERKKAKSIKKYHAPDPPVVEGITPKEESAPGTFETADPVPLTYKVEDYDKALNPFASEDKEASGDTTEKRQSSLAQLTAATIDGRSSLNVSAKGERKSKSSKKRRAPDPPVPNGDSASSNNLATEKSEEQKKSPALPDRKSH